jgi:acyl-CoA thioesterase-1
MRRALKPSVALPIIIAGALAACGPSTAPATPETSGATEEAKDAVPAAPTIVFLGDSLTAGYQLPPEAALPEAVQRVLNAEGVAATIVNAGVSGDTTADGLNRFDFSVIGAKPDLVVIALGANDFLNNLPAAAAKSNLGAMLQRARDANIPAVLLGVTVPDGAAAVGDREAEYAAIYPALSQEYGAPLYNNMLGAVAGKPALLQGDGVHPTEAGVEAMAVDISQFLKPLVSGLSAPPPS